MDSGCPTDSGRVGAREFRSKGQYESKTGARVGGVGNAMDAGAAAGGGAETGALGPAIKDKRENHAFGRFAGREEAALFAKAAASEGRFELGFIGFLPGDRRGFPASNGADDLGHEVHGHFAKHYVFDRNRELGRCFGSEGGVVGLFWRRHIQRERPLT